MDKRTLWLLNAVLNCYLDSDKIRGLEYLKRAKKELDAEIERLENLKIKQGIYTQAA